MRFRPFTSRTSRDREGDAKKGGLPFLSDLSQSSGPPDGGDEVRRRTALEGRPNPALRRDFLVVLEGHGPLLEPGGPPPVVELAYVPDRVVLDPGAFRRYLHGLGRWRWPGPEDMALAVIEDVGNELVPRWARVSVRMEGADGAPHRVMIEDHQPLWRGSVPGGAIPSPGARER
ncbi:hypothetical protein [Pararhodospirillum oryzae]|uniref:Uncharacterized protein n=1 Tax=Pararhodospirillum oryzae TaxID=478448 RepID=A0A512H9Y1_9PROT|nr:hypothetical protein [Pararhodospirillum oryzae]GEO82263.1 hypothetical protein ROR02_23940 [Pararhodospirillum oryzae]